MIKLKETSKGDQKIPQEIKQFIIKADEGEDYHFYHYGSEIPIEYHWECPLGMILWLYLVKIAINETLHYLCCLAVCDVCVT